MPQSRPGLNLATISLVPQSLFDKMPQSHSGGIFQHAVADSIVWPPEMTFTADRAPILMPLTFQVQASSPLYKRAEQGARPNFFSRLILLVTTFFAFESLTTPLLLFMAQRPTLRVHASEMSGWLLKDLSHPRLKPGFASMRKHEAVKQIMSIMPRTPRPAICRSKFPSAHFTNSSRSPPVNKSFCLIPGAPAHVAYPLRLDVDAANAFDSNSLGTKSNAMRHASWASGCRCSENFQTLNPQPQTPNHKPKPRNL
jgi:hypothetical protein